MNPIEILPLLAYGEDTCLPGSWDPDNPAAGHCAVVALILHRKFGGLIVSTRVESESHWFNLIHGVWVDLTAIQFGHENIICLEKQDWWDMSPISRKLDEVNLDTWRRYHLLSQRSGL